MSRIADRRQRRIRRGVFWGLVALLVGYALLAGDRRPHHLLVLWLEERRTEARIAELEAENEALAERREALESDPVALEKLAREKGMMSPGDIVYRIVPVPAGVREAAAESLALRTAVAESIAARPEETVPPEEGARPEESASPEREASPADDPSPIPPERPVDGPSSDP